MRKVEDRESGPSDNRLPAAPASLRQWASIWLGLKGWSAPYDPTVIAANASEADWATFREVLAETNAFARRALPARSAVRQAIDTHGDQTLFDSIDSLDREQE